MVLEELKENWNAINHLIVPIQTDRQLLYKFLHRVDIQCVKAQWNQFGSSITVHIIKNPKTGHAFFDSINKKRQQVINILYSW